MACRPAFPLAFLLVALAARAPGQEAPPKTAAPKPGFESIVPPETLLFVGVDNLDAVRADWAASPWGQLVADPANEALRKAFARLFAELGTTTAKETGVDLVEAFQRITGRVGFGVFGVLEEKSRDYGFTFGAESGDHVAELRASAQKILEHDNEASGIVLKTETEGDVEVTLAVAKDQEAQVPDLRVGAAGPVLIVDGASGKFRDRPNFTNALAALKGEGKESLAALAGFKESRAAKPTGVKVWVDTGAILRARLGAERAAKEPESEFQIKLMDALGIDQLGALSGCVEVNAREMRVDALQSWSGKGLLANLLTAWLAPGDFTLLKFVPAEVEHAVAVHLDFAKGMEASAAINKALGGGDAAPDAGAAPDQNAPPGADAPLDPRKDFMDHLDGRVAFFVADVDVSEALPIPGMEKPQGFCVTLGVKSAEPLRASLDKLLRSFGMHAARKKSEFQGFQVYSIPITPFTAHYAILDDIAVISTSPTLLQDVLRRKSDKELKSLAVDANFKREFDGLSAGVALVGWTRSDPKVFSSIGAPFAAANAEGAAGGPPEAGGEGGDAGGGGKGADGGSTEEELQKVLFGYLEALGTIDPAVAAKHLPAGSVIGFGVDASGIHLEGVSR